MDGSTWPFSYRDSRALGMPGQVLEPGLAEPGLQARLAQPIAEMSFAIDGCHVAHLDPSVRDPIPCRTLARWGD